TSADNSPSPLWFIFAPSPRKSLPAIWTPRNPTTKPVPTPSRALPAALSRASKAATSTSSACLFRVPSLNFAPWAGRKAANPGVAFVKGHLRCFCFGKQKRPDCLGGFARNFLELNCYFFCVFALCFLL